MKLDINLASRSYINRRALFMTYVVITGILIILLLANIRYYGTLSARQQAVQLHLREVRQTLGELQDGVPKEVSKDQMDALKAEVTFANDILEKDSFRWTALLGHLEEVVTEGVRIRSVQPKFKEGSLKINGVAKSVNDLRSFIDRIVASPHFSDVYLFNQNQDDIKDATGREHQAITFSVELKGAF